MGGTSEDERRAELVGRLAADHHEIAMAALRQRLEPLMASTLSIQQLKVLVLAQLDGPVSSHDLSVQLRVSPATMSGIVERLVEAGLLVRHQDQRDRRVWRLTPTPQGTRLAEDVIASGDWQRANILAALTLPELEALAQGVAALRRVISLRET
jgi:DNA-binding MarR family transcriptional regulator